MANESNGVFLKVEMRGKTYTLLNNGGIVIEEKNKSFALTFTAEEVDIVAGFVTKMYLNTGVRYSEPPTT